MRNLAKNLEVFIFKNPPKKHYLWVCVISNFLVVMVVDFSPEVLFWYPAPTLKWALQNNFTPPPLIQKEKQRKGLKKSLKRLY